MNFNAKGHLIKVFFILFLAAGCGDPGHQGGNDKDAEHRKSRQNSVQLSGSESFTEGEKVPFLKLFSLDGEAFSIDENLSGEGSFVLLNFWATWCAPCVKELPSLDKLGTALRDRGVRI